MSGVTEKLVAGFMAFRKENGLGPFRTFVSEAPNTRQPDEHGNAPPVMDYERASAAAQVAEITTMMEPIKDRFQQEREVIATLEKIVATLNKLIAGTLAVEKSSVPSSPPGFLKTFIGYAEPVKPTRVIAANSLDEIVAHAERRVRAAKRYGR